MRKAHLFRKKEECFVNTYNVNDIPLPAYNALHDPYLTDFFKNPQQIRLLRETGVLKKKRKFSMALRKDNALLAEHSEANKKSPSRKKVKRSKSFSKSAHYKAFHLPEIEH